MQQPVLYARAKRSNLIIAVLSQSLRAFGGMAKQPFRLFLCRSLPHLRSAFAPIPGSNPPIIYSQIK